MRNLCSEDLTLERYNKVKSIKKTKQTKKQKQEVFFFFRSLFLNEVKISNLAALLLKQSFQAILVFQTVTRSLTVNVIFTLYFQMCHALNFCNDVLDVFEIPLVFTLQGLLLNFFSLKLNTSTKELLVKIAGKCSKLHIYFKASHQEGAEILVLSLFKFYYSTRSILMNYSVASFPIFPAQLD